eukprot:scaffold8862_cov122-Isochrysis_galbana.AAC.1
MDDRRRTEYRQTEGPSASKCEGRWPNEGPQVLPAKYRPALSALRSPRSSARYLPSPSSFPPPPHPPPRHSHSPPHFHHSVSYQPVLFVHVHAHTVYCRSVCLSEHSYAAAPPAAPLHAVAERYYSLYYTRYTTTCYLLHTSENARTK